MRKIIAVTMILVAGLLAVNAQEPTTPEAKPNKNAPVITFTELVHDYGTIKQGSDGNFDFQFKNSGKDPLIVNNVKSSCGCTVAEYTKDPVAKNKTGVVKVRYNTNNIGSFVKTVTIYSNATNNPVVLTIKGTVEQAAQQQAN